MKPNYVFRLLSLCGLVLFFLASCDKTESDPEPDMNECQIVEYRSNGGVTSYQYNAEGFIIKEVFTSDNKPEKNKTTLYSYDDTNRLIKEEVSSISNSYDNIIYEYKNGILIGVNYYGGWRGDDKSKILYDAKGRIFKIKYDYGEEVTHTYDDEGNVTKTEYHTNGNLTTLFEWGDYDDKERIISAKKGYISLDESKNNPGYMALTYYNSGEVVYQNEIKYTYQYNSSNLPVSVLNAYKSGGVDESTYTYNCEINNG